MAGSEPGPRERTWLTDDLNQAVREVESWPEWLRAAMENGARLRALRQQQLDPAEGTRPSGQSAPPYPFAPKQRIQRHAKENW